MKEQSKVKKWRWKAGKSIQLKDAREEEDDDASCFHHDATDRHPSSGANHTSSCLPLNENKSGIKLHEAPVNSPLFSYNSQLFLTANPSVTNPRSVRKRIRCKFVLEIKFEILTEAKMSIMSSGFERRVDWYERFRKTQSLRITG